MRRRRLVCVREGETDGPGGSGEVGRDPAESVCDRGGARRDAVLC